MVYRELEDVYCEVHNLTLLGTDEERRIYGFIIYDDSPTLLFEMEDYHLIRNCDVLWIGVSQKGIIVDIDISELNDLNEIPMMPHKEDLKRIRLRKKNNGINGNKQI